MRIPIISLLFVLFMSISPKLYAQEYNLYYLTEKGRQQLYERRYSLLINMVERAVLRRDSAYSDSLLDVKTPMDKEALFELGTAIHYLELDSLIGITIGIQCFDSLVMTYNQLLLEGKTEQDELILLDMIRISNTIVGTYYLQEKAIYKDFMANIKVFEIAEKLGFTKSVWDGTYFSLKYRMNVLWGIKGISGLRGIDNFRFSKYAIRYSGS